MLIILPTPEGWSQSRNCLLPALKSGPSAHMSENAPEQIYGLNQLQDSTIVEVKAENDVYRFIKSENTEAYISWLHQNSVKVF